MGSWGGVRLRVAQFLANLWQAEQPANSAGDQRHFLSGRVRAMQGDHGSSSTPATTCCGRLIHMGSRARRRPGGALISRLPRTQPAASAPSARCDAGSAPAAGTAQVLVGLEGAGDLLLAVQGGLPVQAERLQDRDLG
jgi:hypothetical protein